jgi:hypothetical protein
MVKENDIINAYCKIRTIDNTIPDDVLNFMKSASLEKLNETENKMRKCDCCRKHADTLYCENKTISYTLKPCYENNELEIISPKTLKHIIDNLSKEKIIRTLVDRIGTMEYSQTYNVKAEAYIDLTDGSINYRKIYPNQSSTRENLYVTIFQYNLSNGGYDSDELLGDDDSKFISEEIYEKHESNIRCYWEDLSEDVEDDTLRLLKYIDTDFNPEDWCINILNESMKDFKQRKSNCDDAFIEGLLLQDDYNWMPDFNEDDIYFKPDENDFFN